MARMINLVFRDQPQGVLIEAQHVDASGAFWPCFDKRLLSYSQVAWLMSIANTPRAVPEAVADYLFMMVLDHSPEKVRRLMAALVGGV